MKKQLMVVHGPNINLTGIREPGVYGSESLEQINGEIRAYCEEEGFGCEIHQSNHEGQIIDWLHGAMGRVDGIILNAGAYTHYSYAIHDAIAAVKIPASKCIFPIFRPEATFAIFRSLRRSAPDRLPVLENTAICLQWMHLKKSLYNFCRIPCKRLEYNIEL